MTKKNRRQEHVRRGMRGWDRPWSHERFVHGLPFKRRGGGRQNPPCGDPSKRKIDWQYLHLRQSDRLYQDIWRPLEGGPGRWSVMLFVSFLLPMGPPHRESGPRPQSRGGCGYQFSANIERQDRVCGLSWGNGDLALHLLSLAWKASDAQGRSTISQDDRLPSTTNANRKQLDAFVLVRSG